MNNPGFYTGIEWGMAAVFLFFMYWFIRYYFAD